jgi:hypothetical protein
VRESLLLHLCRKQCILIEEKKEAVVEIIFNVLHLKKEKVLNKSSLKPSESRFEVLLTEGRPNADRREKIELFRKIMRFNIYCFYLETINLSVNPLKNERIAYIYYKSQQS